MNYIFFVLSGLYIFIILKFIIPKTSREKIKLLDVSMVFLVIFQILVSFHLFQLDLVNTHKMRIEYIDSYKISLNNELKENVKICNEILLEKNTLEIEKGNPALIKFHNKSLEIILSKGIIVDKDLNEALLEISQLISSLNEINNMHTDIVINKSMLKEEYLDLKKIDKRIKHFSKNYLKNVRKLKETLNSYFEM